MSQMILCKVFSILHQLVIALHANWVSHFNTGEQRAWNLAKSKKSIIVMTKSFCPVIRIFVYKLPKTLHKLVREGRERVVLCPFVLNSCGMLQKVLRELCCRNPNLFRNISKLMRTPNFDPVHTKIISRVDRSEFSAKLD